MPSAAPILLVVEDEEVVGLFLKEELTDAGFLVRLASDAAAGLRAIEEQTDIGAAIIDVGLPDQNGDTLARQCHGQRPTLPIILTTGYDEHPFEQAFATNPYVRVLGKPFDTQRLLLRLEELAVHVH
jgi:DNA-binding response OmpR family regulator